MPALELTVASGDTSLDVSRFSARERISTCFEVFVWARSPSPSVDLSAIVGGPATFVANIGSGAPRRWAGVCSHAEQVHVAQNGQSTYCFSLVPKVWLLSQRRDYRLFQHETLPDIADEVFANWGIDPVWKIERSGYQALELRVQYGESDLDFLDRVLEEAGITYTFPDEESATNRITLDEWPHAAAPRASPIPYRATAREAGGMDYVSDVRLGHEVRRGARSTLDYDFRKPRYRLFAEAPKARAPEDRYEDYGYAPGAFLVHSGRQDNSPIADDQGIVRHDETAGNHRVERELAADRTGKRSVTFDASVVDLWPGVVFSISDHPHPEVDLKKLLVTELFIEGANRGELAVSGRAVFADAAYRPPLRTRRPRISSLQPATIVGPNGSEVYTDEFGRVRVQFPWDRTGQGNEYSSCWMRVSQGWAGAGYGMMHLPRIGQEVIVAFLDGNPDQPVVVGRVYNRAEPVPYNLPEQMVRSAWKSNSSPREGKDGNNELYMDDQHGAEVLSVQAERQLRTLVKNDETITVGHDQVKKVEAHEVDTTGKNRFEVTGSDRTQTISGSRTTAIGGTRSVLVKGTTTERVEVEHRVLAGKDNHLIVHRDRMHLVWDHDNLHVDGDDALAVGGTLSILTSSLQISLGKDGDAAIEAHEDVHYAAAENFVGEGADVTLSGPGGFLRIDASGVTISGTLVQINAGGSGLAGKGAAPAQPGLPKEAKVDKPCAPQDPAIDNVDGPKDVGCGGYSWKIWWRLPTSACSDGWVIQEILAKFTVNAKDGSTVFSKTYHYWEAWELHKGKKVTIWQDQKLDDNDDQYFAQARPNTKGTITCQGIAKFHEGALPGDFKKNNPDTIAGILDSTTTKPAFWDGSGTVHNLSVEWDCTGVPKSSSVSAQAGAAKLVGTK